jgi:hypothetical protein
MKKKPSPVRSMRFEYEAIAEDLENDDLPVADQMKLQYRQCELFLQIKQHMKAQKEKELIAAKSHNVEGKRFYHEGLSDKAAFLDFLANKENQKKYKSGTLRAWKYRILNGKMPRTVFDVLKNAGYTIKTQRTWNKPSKNK